MKRLQVREVVVSYKNNKRAKVPLAIKQARDFEEVLPKLLTTNLKEHFIAFYLDSSHNVISYSIVSIGLINATQVHPREVFQPAIALGAVSIVVAHNHPSGKTEPSYADVKVTRDLKAAGELLGIKLLDHIIFTSDKNKGCYSMSENGQGF